MPQIQPGLQMESDGVMRVAIDQKSRMRGQIMRKFYIFVVCCLLTTSPNHAQQKPNTELIDILSVNPTIVLDIRYATENNFTHHKLYPVVKCMLRREAAESLSAVQKELKSRGLGLKVFDGYRPLSIQKKLWEAVPDERYVANPAKGSRHNRGAAVDLTIIDSLGNEIEMPTPYDDFTVKAHCDYMKLPNSVLKNRALLEQVMNRHGFLPMSTEWWHFDFQRWGRFEILDQPLE
jgi:zinc D-Ala-D-Ala dipeptidase